jgi:predicted phage tail protein
MKKTGLIIIALFSGLMIKAQKGTIKSSVVNAQQVALENATVELIKSSDSSLVKAAFTDKSGFIEIENIPFGNYLLRISSVNYNSAYTSVFTLSASVKPDKEDSR